MEGAEGLTQKLSKFTRGSWAGFINKPSNVDINRDGTLSRRSKPVRDAIKEGRYGELLEAFHLRQKLNASQSKK
jgi:hypothetical protein